MKKCWFHKWEKKAESGSMIDITYFVCEKCRLVKIVKKGYNQHKVTYENFPLKIDDINQIEMCEACGSTNKYYSSEFSYDKKNDVERIAGIFECLDCGQTRYVR